MTYFINVPFEVDKPVNESDPDVLSLARLPGFLAVRPVSPDRLRYELSFEIEAGSVRDATDAADEMIVDVENALDAYHPRVLAPLSPSAR